MPRQADPRNKAVRTAGRLFSEQGYSATGLAQIIEESGSPKGSFYFHFPGGKEQLATEAVTASGMAITAALRELLTDARTPAELLRTYLTLQVRQLAESDFRRGCPVATVALEMSASSEPIRAAAARVFDSWVEVFAEALRGAGHQPEAAQSLARHMVAAFEGALLLSRTVRSMRPLHDTENALRGLLEPR